MSPSAVPSFPSLRSTAGVEPFSFFKDLRDQGAIIWDAEMRSWIVSDYETCREIESDEKRFANAYRKPNPLFNEIKGGANITSMKGEEHRRIRHFHLKLLSPAAVRSIAAISLHRSWTR